jgi:acetyl esterase/lipase
MHIENVFIALPDSPKLMRLRIYRPKSSDSPVPILLWLHGGGYIIGKPEISEAACIEYVRELGIVIVSVDYRLAPDYPFPTPLEDGYTALTWVHDHAAELGIDTARLAIGGESAGAGLAAALVQLACDRKEFKPVFQLLVYPMLDNQTTLRADLAHNRYLAWDQSSNRYGWASYLGKKTSTADIPTYAVPARREDLAGLPPAWIGVGTLDLFYDEDVTYAQRLKACGVDCELVIVPGAFHGFDVIASSALQVIRDFRTSQIAAMKRYLF